MTDAQALGEEKNVTDGREACANELHDQRPMVKHESFSAVSVGGNHFLLLECQQPPEAFFFRKSRDSTRIAQ